MINFFVNMVEKEKPEKVFLRHQEKVKTQKI